MGLPRDTSPNLSCAVKYGSSLSSAGVSSGGNGSAALAGSAPPATAPATPQRRKNRRLSSASLMEETPIVLFSGAYPGERADATFHLVCVGVEQGHRQGCLRRLRGLRTHPRNLNRLVPA